MPEELLPQLLMSYIGRKRFEARLMASEIWGAVNKGASGGGSKSAAYKEVPPDQFLKITGHGMI